MQALPLLDEAGNQLELMFLKIYKGVLEIDETAHDEASLRDTEAILLESLETARKFGNKMWTNVYIPILLARIAQKRGEYSQAVARICEFTQPFTSLWNELSEG